MPAPAPVIAAVISLVRAILFTLSGLFFLQIYDRLVSIGGQDLVTPIAAFAGTSIAILLLLGWARIWVLRRSYDPRFVRWHAGRTDLITGIPVFAMTYLLYPSVLVIAVVGFAVALLVSRAMSGNGRGVRTITAVALCLVAFVTAHLTATGWAVNQIISLGAAALIPCFVAWATWIGFIHWHRPVADADVF